MTRSTAASLTRSASEHGCVHTKPCQLWSKNNRATSSAIVFAGMSCDRRHFSNQTTAPTTRVSQIRTAAAAAARITFKFGAHSKQKKGRRACVRFRIRPTCFFGCLATPTAMQACALTTVRLCIVYYIHYAQTAPPHAQTKVFLLDWIGGDQLRNGARVKASVKRSRVESQVRHCGPVSL